MNHRWIPNPWIAIPSLVVGLVAGVLGWTVTEVSCRPGSCQGWAVGMAIGAFLIATSGMLVVMVLVFRSLSEHYQSRAEPPDEEEIKPKGDT